MSRMTVGTPSSTPINNLPRKVIAQILVQLHRLRDDWEELMPWYRVLWVCRLWREVAQETPALWCDIKIRKYFRQSYLEASLRYSLTMPIDIAIGDTSPAQNHTVIKLIVPHISRLRNLQIRGLDDTHDDALRMLLHQTMPALEELGLHFNVQSRLMGPYEVNEMCTFPGLHTPKDPFVWNLQYEQFPNLRRLFLGGAVKINGLIPPFPLLRQLELHECLSAPITIVEFAYYLSQHPHLEEFTISRYRPAIRPVPTPMALPPLLRKFTIEDNSYYTEPFLSSFHFPAHIDIRITRTLDFMDYGDLPDGHWEPPLTVQNALPRDRSTLPILTEVTSIELRHYMMSRYSLIGITPSGHTVRLTGQIREESPDQHPDLHSFTDLIEVFRRAPVVELFVNGNDATLIEKEHWENALAAFPTLERIVIDDTESLTEYDARLSLLDALQPPKRVRNAGVTERSSVPAPQLKTLVMTSVAMDDEDVEFTQALARCLRSRKDKGHELPQLKLVLEYIQRPASEDGRGEDEVEEADRDNARRVKVYTRALKALVGDLQLDVVNDFDPKDIPSDYED
ncbi:hypothetical protein C8Q79DRAFT_1012710 [Trametes meyenii]|nr:hypothetical protein C8Q79DRAFT_1012710 [Trametes meyenii]